MQFWDQSNILLVGNAGFGTWCSGLVGKVRVDHRLDSVILEGFSNLSHSGIVQMNLFVTLQSLGNADLAKI